MRILIIRHGDPDYEHDTLTKKGWREAGLLADRLSKMDIKEFYVSPLGRAKDTASLTLQKMNRSAAEYEWLREFAPKVHRPDMPDREKAAWDWLPKDWTNKEYFYQHSRWFTSDIFEAANVKEEYEWITQSFDRFLEDHGYVRNGRLYHVKKANRDTIALFCHFGLECVLLSHLMHVSPMILWHHTCAPSSSVTTIYTEERREGTAIFRMNGFGDISHLYAANEEPAFSARFCETYDCMEERHD